MRTPRDTIRDKLMRASDALQTCNDHLTAVGVTLNQDGRFEKLELTIVEYIKHFDDMKALILDLRSNI